MKSRAERAAPAAKGWAEYDNRPLEDYCRALKERYGAGRRLLLIQTPQILFDSFDREIAKRRGYYCFPPTGLQFLHEALKGRDLEIRIEDLNFQLLKRMIDDPQFSLEKWLTLVEGFLDEFKPDIVGVSCLFDAGIRALLELLDLLKERGEAIVLAGGVIATFERERLLSQGLCHFVVEGEGEEKINFLLDRLTGEDTGAPPRPKISFHDGQALCQSRGPAEAVRIKGDLTASYGMVPVEEYYRYGSLNPFSRIAGLDDSPFAAIQLSRGCRGECTFCSVRSFMGQGVRARPAEDVLKEMEFLITERGVRHFEWLDDDLLFKKKDLTRILQAIIDRQWPITWSANNGLVAASINEEMLRLIRDSGCIGFKVGVETGNEEMLKKVRKPGTLKNFRLLGQRLKDYPEVFVGGNFIIGLPEESFGQMMDSFFFAKEVGYDWAALTVCQAIRGASAFEDFEDYFDDQMAEKGGLVKNFIPARGSADGHIDHEQNILTGLNVFKLNAGLVPDEEQVKEIWFTFNLIVNFIENKNLKPGGRVEKFIGWVEMALQAYPANPYMCLFVALAYLVADDHKHANEFYIQAVGNADSPYWQERFEAFGLSRMLSGFPKGRDQAFEALAEVSSFVSSAYETWSEKRKDI